MINITKLEDVLECGVSSVIEDGITYEVKVSEGGLTAWRLGKKIHRVNGPALYRPNGLEIGHLDDVYHRIGAPAYNSADGVQIWALHGKMHRTDGPAYSALNGSNEYYLYGDILTEEDFILTTKIRKNLDLAVMHVGHVCKAVRTLCTEMLENSTTIISNGEA